MMLTQRLSVLAHDLAKQCHVTGSNKPEERLKAKEEKLKTGCRKSHHSVEGKGEADTTPSEWGHEIEHCVTNFLMPIIIAVPTVFLY